ncbi:MAG: isochorismatase family protein [Hyphomicrobiales bacterium]
MGSERDIYAAQGFGNALGVGAAPALLIVDFVNGFADPEVFGGGNIADAIAATVPLLELARAHKWPVATTRIVFADDGSDANVFSAKVPSLLGLTEESAIGQVVPELAPEPGELIVRKRHPSAFFGTDLTQWLTGRRVDTLFVAGCTTSGCIRASVIDAMCHGFRPVVVTDCVGDRALGPHEANLFDMGQKCADLMSFTAVADRFKG